MRILDTLWVNEDRQQCERNNVKKTAPATQQTMQNSRWIDEASRSISNKND